MTLLYYHDRFLDHITGCHPERPARLAQVTSHLDREGLVACCQRQPWPGISTERISRIHRADYVAHVADFARRGGGRLDEDTVVCPASFDVACLAAGAVADAVDRVMLGKQKT